MNKKICPFCKEDNFCLPLKNETCWCTNFVVPTSLINLLPSKYKNNTCICKKCIVFYQNNKYEFVKKYTIS